MIQQIASCGPRMFIEVYRVEDGVEVALLLAAGKILRFGCEDF